MYMLYTTLASDSEQVYPITGGSDRHHRTGDTRVPVREDDMNGVRESTQALLKDHPERYEEWIQRICKRREALAA